MYSASWALFRNGNQEMSINSISLTLFVDDLEQAVEFYTVRLGIFTCASDLAIGAGETVSVKFGGVCSCFELDLCDVSSSQELCKLVGKQGGDALLLTFPIDSTEKMEAHLSINQVDIYDRYELPYAEWLFVQDPFGNRIALCEDLTASA